MKYIVGMLCKCLSFLCFLCPDVDFVNNFSGSILTGLFNIFLHLLASIKLLNKSVLLKLVVNVLLNELRMISYNKRSEQFIYFTGVDPRDGTGAYQLHPRQPQVIVKSFPN